MPAAGTYKVRVKTPKGIQEGKMTLVVEGDLLRGTLEYSAGISKIEGVTNGSRVEFTTQIKTPLGRFKAAVTGVVDGNTFSGVAKIPFGSARIDGIRL